MDSLTSVPDPAPVDPAPPPASPFRTIALRSGDLVNQSTTNTGLVGVLLAPWLSGWLRYVEDHSGGYLDFGQGYELQLTAGLIVAAMAIRGRIHMWQLRDR